MKYLFIFLLLPVIMSSCTEPNPRKYTSFSAYPSYPEDDLWLEYHPESTRFKLWSPMATAVRLNLYEKGTGGELVEQHNLSLAKEGLWQVEVAGDLNGKYYTYQVKIDNNWLEETPGIYAQAVGVNGKRGMIVDLKETNPDNWSGDTGPTLTSPNKAIIYELHVRDLTSHPNSGSSLPGKFLGLTESGTVDPNGNKTGLDHLLELGVTHVHLLPAFDHYSIDETKLDSPQFNWGYDPHNYNVPEGSFATDPFDGKVRIREFKEMVQTLHENGIGVILDVVYNHTGRTENSNFNLEAPGYYYRQRDDGTLSDASGCGNETASDRPMMRKFILESVLYWAREYHLDGFRFDLMGIHDITTMNEVGTVLKSLDPNLFVYGEGWTAGSSPLPDDQKALKRNTLYMPQISAFSDDIRDGLKGSVFDEMSTGFVSGAQKMEESVKFGVVGSIFHKQINYSAVNYSDTAWALEPWQAISYVSCHDNHTLFDKLRISRPNASKQDLIRMDLLANAVVLTSQGIPFLHAGSEMLRTKGGEHNSYNLPDKVNQIDWNWKNENMKVYNYYKDLIALRKAHPAFSMATASMVQNNLRFLPSEPGLVGYTLTGAEDDWKEILVYYNANDTNKKVSLKGNWKVAVYDDQISPQGIMEVKGSVEIPKISLFIAYRD